MLQSTSAFFCQPFLKWQSVKVSQPVYLGRLPFWSGFTKTFISIIHFILKWLPLKWNLTLGGSIFWKINIPSQTTIFVMWGGGVHFRYTKIFPGENCSLRLLQKLLYTSLGLFYTLYIFTTALHVLQTF